VRHNNQSRKAGIYVALALLGATLAACKSDSSSSGTRASNEARPSADPAARVDILCVGDRINNPPETFHYSYKYSDAAGSIDNEAEITPQTIDIKSTDKSGTHSFHGVRTDEASWNAAVLDLSSLRLTAMSARLDSLNGTSAIKAQGTEPVNGYSATKYSIDTTQASAADRQQYATLFGKGSFEKGTLWQPADGCAVKLILDDATARPDGTVSQGHYEISRINP
jgi:hypothetical protein